MRTARARRLMAFRAAFALAALVALPGAALAQDRDADADTAAAGRGGGEPDPASPLPPGLCRVVMPDAPAERQGEPTDCEIAMRRAAATASARVELGRATLARGGPVACGGTSASYPDAAPAMTWGVPGAGIDEATRRRYGVRPAARPATGDFDGDGVPETVTWFDGDRVVQLWHDPDGDGVADLVEVWCDGQRVGRFAY